MPALSAKNLQGDQHRRWAKNRKEMYRGVLRDPRVSPVMKARAKKKLDDTRLTS